MAHSLIAYAVPVEGPAPGLFSLNVPSFVWPRFFVSELATDHQYNDINLPKMI